MLRTSASIAKRSQNCFCFNAARFFGDLPKPRELKTPGFEPGELGTVDKQGIGAHYEEYVQYVEGHRRFNRGPLMGPFGTQEEPCEVLSAFNSRIVGCIGGGKAGEHPVNWLNVKAGRKTVCVLCGQFFSLVSESKTLETEVAADSEDDEPH
jgi:cytochrome c oxidase subunit 5b